MNGTLKSLIENIKATKIIIIENDFIYIDDAEELLSKLCLLKAQELEQLLDEISYEGSSLDQEKIFSYVSTVSAIDNPEKEKYLAAGKVEVFLEMNDLAGRFIKQERIVSETEKLMSDLNKKTFLKYGICGEIPNDYKELISIIESVQGVKLRIFKDLTHRTETDIESEVMMGPGDGYFLFIVDKNLGGNDSQGGDFIERFLISNLKKQKGLNIVSVLYTTHKVESEVQGFNNYFAFEISKQDENRLKQLSTSLAKCAYVDLFRQLKETHKESFEYAFELAIKKGSNMVYLASMAHEEGITAFESINKWFDLTRMMRLTEQLLGAETNKYKRIISLSHYISEEFLFNETIDFDSESNASSINVYEIFDYTINIQHLTPAPGDIFKWEGKYYVLVGQDCDFTIRKNSNTREAKVADLVEANFIKLNNYNKVDVDTYGKVIFNYFKDSENYEIGALEINLNSRITCDFSVLDLCAFNNYGHSTINTEAELEASVESMLPKTWKRHHESLKVKLKKVIEINSLTNTQQLSSLLGNDISIFHHKTPVTAPIVTYPLTRVCRLKNEFKGLVNKNFWDFRGRIGVNTINIDRNESVSCNVVKIGFIGQEEEVNVEFQGIISQINKRKTNLEKTQLPFEVDLRNIKRRFSGIYDLSNLGDSITLNNKEITVKDIRIEKYVDKNTLKGIKISIPYTVNGRARISKSDIKITQILPQHSAQFKNDTSLFFTYGDNDQPFPFLVDGQLKTFDIVGDISRRIRLPQFDLEVVLERGNINVIELKNEAAATVALAMNKK